MKALLVGYGKMGRAIESELLAKGHAIAGRIDEGDPLENFLEGDRPGMSSEGESGRGIDVAFDFSTAASAEGLILFLLSKKIPVVSGTTGWEVAPAIRFAREQKVPFLHSPNFSVGVAVMKRLAAQAAGLLAAFPEFEPGIVERHHAAKKDGPSGTAKLLASAVQLPRAGVQVPVVALRQGGQPGEHVLYFEGASESLEIVHRARSRAIFAAGAVACAEWMLACGRAGPVTFDEFLDAVSRERSSR